MGTNKALLEVGGSGMLERTASLLRPLVGELFLVANDPAPYTGLDLPVIPDLYPGCGALGGIHAAIAHAAYPLVLCVACDMPHIRSGILQLLLSAADRDDDALIPRADGRPEPLLAVYGRGALSGIERSIGVGRLKIMDALAGLRLRFVDDGALKSEDPGRRSFFNVNTPEDLAAARACAAQGDHR